MYNLLYLVAVSFNKKLAQAVQEKTFHHQTIGNIIQPRNWKVLLK